MRTRLTTRALAIATALLLPVAVLISATPAAASTFVSGCDQVVLASNDDGSSDQVTLPFTLQFGSRSFDYLWVNNNGNLTFDEPQSQYTPYGLEGTSREIIAPFFADVDTRGTGTVSYGETTYQGHQAFCATWDSVGYFYYNTDLTDTFQVILVNRNDISPGAFDVIFNYGAMQWEAGDASSGAAGKGGTSAAVGFSNGDVEYFQMAGSLIPGSFTDDGVNPISQRSNTGIPGQWRWGMRNGTAPSEYVAMGDSFSSGEGTEYYFSDTDVASNRCHRSPDAYAEIIVGSGIGQQLRFVACSGAKLNEISHPENSTDKGGEPAQWDSLSDKTRLVTISIVGNDLEFAGTLSDCVKAGVGAAIGGPLSWGLASCQNIKGGHVNDLLTSLASGTLHKNLTDVYAGIRVRAPRAKVVVVTYPQFYRPVSWRTWAGICEGFRGSDQQWINDSIAKADAIIANIAHSYGYAVADQTDVFSGSGHALCAGGEVAMNGIIPFDGDDHHVPGRGSYHPNILGQFLMSQRVASVIGGLGPLGQSAPLTPALSHPSVVASPMDTTSSQTIPLTQGQQVQRTLAVDGSELAVNASWQDGVVGLALTSPSGTTYSTSSPGAASSLSGPTYGRLAITSPEKGTWTISLTGTTVYDPTVDVALTSTVIKPLPAPPTAHLTWSVDAAGVVHLDGSQSSDPTGGTLTYHWDFGDGYTATGVAVSHAYTLAGAHVPTLVVHSSSGLDAYATAQVVVQTSTGAAGGTQVVPVDASGVPVTSKPTAVPRARGAFAAKGLGTISWAPPIKGYPTNFSYTYRISGNGTTTYGSARHTSNRYVALSGLKPGGTYRVQLTAANAQGAGPTTTFIFRVPKLAKPSVPRSVKVSYPATGSLKISWTSSKVGGFPGPLLYRVTVTRTNGRLVGKAHVVSATRFTVTGLKVGTTYRVTVMAVNGTGHSAAVTFSARPRRV